MACARSQERGNGEQDSGTRETRQQDRNRRCGSVRRTAPPPPNCFTFNGRNHHHQLYSSVNCNPRKVPGTLKKKQKSIDRRGNYTVFPQRASGRANKSEADAVVISQCSKQLISAHRWSQGCPNLAFDSCQKPPYFLDEKKFTVRDTSEPMKLPSRGLRASVISEKTLYQVTKSAPR